MTKAVQDLMVEVERARDRFQAGLFTDPDPDVALAAAGPECAVVNLPVGTGAPSRAELHRYLVEDLHPHLPADLTFRRVSRTGNRWSVVDETMVGLTHDRTLPWLLPGVAPTGRHAEVLAISVVTVRGSRVTVHRTLWDHTGLLAQLGIDPAAVRTTDPAGV